jgi:hypothetical protein
VVIVAVTAIKLIALSGQVINFITCEKGRAKADRPAWFVGGKY